MKPGRLITIGSFDGVHRGHQALIDRTVAEARKREVKSLALSFPMPPRMVLDRKTRRMILSDESEKGALLRRAGIDEVAMLPFDAEMAAMRPFTFFRDVILKKFKARGVVVGSDFRFGAGRSGGAFELVRWGQDFSIPVWVIAPVRFRRTVVSSTLVRTLFTEGRFQTASEFLGHPYLISGVVRPERGVGRKIGFPTANLATHPDKILPPGVFAVRGWIETKGGKRKLWPGVANIGVRPTFKAAGPAVEAHFFGDPGRLAGRRVSIELLRRLRSERRFRSPAALASQIEKDIAAARRFFRGNGRS
ncbi:MAG: riboflavin biosynthesis protein RibF [Elusimicrobia bacterium]|nr:riboflavin biosynthesis protein RibF [Elusimicrobiota bacterium]